MTSTTNRIAAAALALTIILSMDVFGQDSTGTLKQPDQIMEDLLDLNDPMLSIWPNVNTIEIEVLSAGIDRLKGAYEADRLEADERTRKIDAMISEVDRDQEVIKEKNNLAKEAKDDVEKERLKDLKNLYSLRRKYLVRIKKLRDVERQLAETRLDNISQLGDVLKIANELAEARETRDGYDLLGIERELIRQSKQLGVTLNGVATNLKKVNTERDKAFDEREKLISAHN